MLCACSIFFFSAFCLCLPDNMDILPRRRALSRARSLLPERWRYPVEAAAQGGAEDARARIGHARPLAGVDDAGAAFRPVPGVGAGQRAGSDRRQALQPVAARPHLRSSRPRRSGRHEVYKAKSRGQALAVAVLAGAVLAMLVVFVKLLAGDQDGTSLSLSRPVGTARGSEAAGPRLQRPALAPPRARRRASWHGPAAW